MNDAARKGRYRLRLYIAGPGAYATRAQQNLERIAADAGFDYDLEVVDLRKEPERAEQDHIVVTPTLVKLSPPPRFIVIGDLSEHAKIAESLGRRGR